MFTNVQLPTITPHHEVVSSLQAMQHQQWMMNIARQTDLSQKLVIETTGIIDESI